LCDAGRGKSVCEYLVDAAVVATSATAAIVACGFVPIVEDAFVMAGVVRDVAPWTGWTMPSKSGCVV
jgi:hypothetical protein